MHARGKKPDFAPRKLPAQRRSRETFEAIVEACTWLLPRRGYAGTTTNHIAERAGVNISSLYEYFPGKETIVAQVADRLVERVLGQLEEGAAEVLGDATASASPAASPMRRWIDLIYETVARERRLVTVFLYQVPFTNQLPAIQSVGARLLEFSQRIRDHSGVLARPDFTPATMHLVINLVTSTIYQLVLDPPRDATREEMLDELAGRLEGWVRAGA